MNRYLADPFVRMQQLDNKGQAHTVTVTTMAHQHFKQWPVLTHDDSWLVLRNPEPDTTRGESDAPVHVLRQMITSLIIHTD